MKLTDKLVAYFGTDKLLHFLIGMIVPLLFVPLVNIINIYGIITVVCTGMLMIVLNFIKEKWLDSFFDWKDLIACVIGVIFSIGLSIFYYFI